MELRQRVLERFVSCVKPPGGGESFVEGGPLAFYRRKGVGIGVNALASLAGPLGVEGPRF